MQTSMARMSCQEEEKKEETSASDATKKIIWAVVSCLES